VSNVVCDHTELRETDRQLKLGMAEKPEIELADVVRLAEISATTGVQYVRPDEVRKMLVRIGFELTKPQQQQGGEE
jgi:transposase